MLTVENICAGIMVRYFPGFATQLKGILTLSIVQPDYSTKHLTAAFSGIVELSLGLAILNNPVKLSTNEEILVSLKSLDISNSETKKFGIYPGLIDTQLSEFKILSGILLSLRFPIGKEYENKDSYFLMDIPDLKFENTMFELYSIQEDTLRSNIRNQIGGISWNCLQEPITKIEESQNEQ